MIIPLIFLVQTKLTFEKNALPIFKNRCSLCHNYFPDKDWRNYDIAYLKRNLILDRVWIKKDMPPNNSTAMTENERNTIKLWIDEGALK